MDAMNSVRDLAREWLSSIYSFATGVTGVLDSTVPELLRTISGYENMPPILETLINAIAGVFSLIPQLNDKTIFSLLFSGIITVLVMFIIIKFFGDIVT